MVDGFVSFMGSEDALCGPINLGNPSEFTILQLAEKVLDLVGGTSRIVRRPLPMDDPRQRKPDISMAQERLSWEPRVDLDQGLSKTIRYFDDLLKTYADNLDFGRTW
jgi:UDP-glucuronate decarboxylase